MEDSYKYYIITTYELDSKDVPGKAVIKIKINKGWYRAMHSWYVSFLFGGKMRFFEKISFEQFKKDVSDDIKLYESYELPKRSTMNSAGYDIKSLESVIIKPSESKVVKTGLKVSMNDNEVFLIYVRSSLGYKYDVSLSNSVGVIDKDFYNNESNEGHFSIKLRNDGDKDFVVNIGDRIAQGIFTTYLTVDNEEIVNNVRKGGVGSTNKGEEK